jgi:hypothetical protein
MCVLLASLCRISIYVPRNRVVETLCPALQAQPATEPSSDKPIVLAEDEFQTIAATRCTHVVSPDGVISLLLFNFTFRYSFFSLVQIFLKYIRPHYLLFGSWPDQSLWLCADFRNQQQQQRESLN